MTAISFATNPKAFLRGARTLLVVGATRRFRKDLPTFLDKRTRDLLTTVAKETSTGDQGAVGSTFRTAKPTRLQVGVLPNSLSRYNSPARAESVRKVVASADLGTTGKAAVLLLLDDPDHALAAVNAVGRGLPEFRAKSGKAPSVRVEILAVGPDGAMLELDELVTTTLEANRASAELVDTPPSDLHPEAFAARATDMLKGIKGVKVRQIADQKLVSEGLGGIYGVGKGATSRPRMLIATYTPPDPAKLHVALVGKGVTFDTGGLHLKGRGFMEGMKSDMGGAAAMLGAFRVLASTGCKHQVTLLLCMAENAIGPGSYKPDDILTLHSGKTVEINNTDAEGRLLLADGVSYAARELAADVVFDAATLTGAQLIALGSVHAAVVSNDADLEALVVDAGRHSGDLCHPLPFAPELYKQEFKSKVADMRNSVANRMNAQSACAAQFVYWHMEDAPKASRRRWCHIDLAGPAFPAERGTGYGVALVSEAVRRLTR